MHEPKPTGKRLRWLVTLAALVVAAGATWLSSPSGSSPAARGTPAELGASAKTSDLQASQRAESAAPRPADPVSPRLRRSMQRNLEPAVSFPEALLDSCIAAWRPLPLGVRVARWAEFFLEQGRTEYRFGLKPGGYVAESLLVQDFRQDCVLFSYRCSELARAENARDALLWALATRFAAAPLDSVVSVTGAVDYDHPSHLDYSLDLVRSGFWGRDVSRDVGIAVDDRAGTSRFPAGSFAYIPTEKLRLERLADGDLLYFVFDEQHPRGKKMRQEYGLVIGHQGIVQRSNGTVTVIHAAQSDLSGEYTGNRIVRVPLTTYLRRVESFKGIIVTRLDDAPRPPLSAPGG